VERAIASGTTLEIVVEQGWHRWEGQLVVAREGVQLSSQPHSSLTGRWVWARGSSGVVKRTSFLYSCATGTPQISILVLGGSGKGVGPWALEHCRIYSHGEGSIAMVCSGASRLLLTSCILGGHNQEETASTGLVGRDSCWISLTQVILFVICIFLPLNVHVTYVSCCIHTRITHTHVFTAGSRWRSRAPGPLRRLGCA
jgi:hypothetical protein